MWRKTLVASIQTEEPQIEAGATLIGVIIISCRALKMKGEDFEHHKINQNEIGKRTVAEKKSLGVLRQAQDERRGVLKLLKKFRSSFGNLPVGVLSTFEVADE